MLPRLHNNTNNNTTNLNHTIPTLIIILPHDISHDNTTTTITLPNRNRWTIILGALFGIPTTHSYADDTTFIIIPVLLYVDDTISLKIPTTFIIIPVLLYVNDTISLKIPTYTPNDA